MAKRTKGTNIIVWVLLGLLILGLAGFGFDSFGTSMRTIGQVGSRDIDADEYSLALRNEVRAASQRFGQPITMDQAFALGLDRRVLQGLVQRAAFDNEADRIGLSAGDARVQQEVVSQPAFQGLDGSFDRAAYRAALRNAGLTEPGYERQVREEITRSLLQGAVAGGLQAPDSYVDTLLSYLSERRSFTRLPLTRADMATPLPEPDEATLRAYYDAHPDAFTAPETRNITYAWITPDMLTSEVAVDEGAVQALYDQRADQYQLPERRLVERIIFDTEDAARAAMDRIGPDGAGFDEVVKERGLGLADVDIGDVTLADLGEAGPEIFAASAPAVLGPLPSRFGPAIYRVNGVLPAQVTPIDEVRDDLVAELSASQTRREVDQLTEKVNDLLAGGATLEDVANETKLQLGSIGFQDGMDEGVAAYPEFREAAATISEDDFPEAINLSDGGLIALRLDAVVPPQIRPFDKVTVKVIEAWATEETTKRLTARAEDIISALKDGSSFADLGLEPETVTGITRDGFVEGAAPGMIAAVFAMKEGALRIVTGNAGQVEVLRLDKVLPPDMNDPDVVTLRGDIGDALTQGIAQDAFGYFSDALQQSAGISLNSTAIQAVNALLRGTATGGAPRGGN
ncbi:peptidyl-prolyl cis-trans isomerase D [Rhodobacteraceae bacterium MBR-64]